MNRSIPLTSGLEPFPGYRLIQVLGQGGNGGVWQAKSPNGANVALKFMPCDDTRAASQETRAIQLVRHLDHPNLIRIDNVWMFGGYIVVAMELADGSLLDLLDVYQAELKTPMVPEQVCLLLAQVAEALDFLNTPQHLHGGKVVGIQHGDIKPGNMLVQGEVVKLADFGTALTMAGQFQSSPGLGTMEFAAPEIFQGRVTQWSDQYSLAVSYCALRGGRLPFPDTPPDPDPRYVRPAPDLSMVSAAERPVIAQALNRVPQNRWPSCREMIAQLVEVVY